MNEQQAHEALIQHWRTQWELLRPTVPWTLTNELADSEAEYVRVAVVPALSRQVALGAIKRWRRSGTVGVQVFTPAGGGTSRASELADDVRTVLEGRFILGNDDEPIVTYAGSSGSPLSDGKWFMLTVTFPYTFDQMR